MGVLLRSHDMYLGEKLEVVFLRFFKDWYQFTNIFSKRFSFCSQWRMQRLTSSFISCIYKFNSSGFNICPTSVTVQMDFSQVQVSHTVLCLSVISYVSSINNLWFVSGMMQWFLSVLSVCMQCLCFVCLFLGTKVPDNQRLSHGCFHISPYIKPKHRQLPECSRGHCCRPRA